MTIKKFEAGQTAYLLGNSRHESNKDGVAEVKVISVGRKYVAISGSREPKFKDTAESKPYLIEHSERGAPRMLFPSRKAVDEYLEREELKSWVREAAGWDKIDRYTIEQLREVKRILANVEE